jgi:hypothetical protein
LHSTKSRVIHEWLVSWVVANGLDDIADFGGEEEGSCLIGGVAGGFVAFKDGLVLGVEGLD